MATELTQELWEELRKPFPLEAHSFVPKATTRDKTRALALAYVDPRTYTERLDEVVGLGGWSREYDIIPANGRVMVICRVTVLGHTFQNGGECRADDENALTSAMAQAFKRACSDSPLGLGRYLYSLPQWWAGYDANKKRFTREGYHMLRDNLAKVLAGESRSGGNGNGRNRPKKAQTQAHSGNDNGRNGNNDDELSIPSRSEETTQRARAVELSFGKHSGKTLGQVFDEDRGYVEWLSTHAEDRPVRGASMYLIAHFSNGHGKNGGMSLDDALAVTMPFGTRDHPEYKGRPLSEIERADPGLVDWLADKARSPQLQGAAETIVAAR